MGISENQNNYRQTNVRELSNNFQHLRTDDDNKSQITDRQNEGGELEGQNVQQSN